MKGRSINQFWSVYSRVWNFGSEFGSGTSIRKECTQRFNILADFAQFWWTYPRPQPSPTCWSGPFPTIWSVASRHVVNNPCLEGWNKRIKARQAWATSSVQDQSEQETVYNNKTQKGRQGACLACVICAKPWAQPPPPQHWKIAKALCPYILWNLPGEQTSPRQLSVLPESSSGLYLDCYVLAVVSAEKSLPAGCGQQSWPSWTLRTGWRGKGRGWGQTHSKQSDLPALS